MEDFPAMHSDKKIQQGEANTPYVQQIHIKQGTRLTLENILGSPKIVAAEEQEAGVCSPAATATFHTKQPQ